MMTFPTKWENKSHVPVTTNQIFSGETRPHLGDSLLGASQRHWQRLGHRRRRQRCDLGRGRCRRLVGFQNCILVQICGLLLGFLGNLFSSKPRFRVNVRWFQSGFQAISHALKRISNDSYRQTLSSASLDYWRVNLIVVG